MNYCSILLLILFLALPSSSSAEDFLGAPIPPQHEIEEKTDLRLGFKTDLSHDAIVEYYKEKLKEQKDIKFRDKKDSTFIEDHGNLPWHSITIAKGHTKGTLVVIVRDNWTWIIGTLILRYVGVFVVLVLIFLVLAFSGSIISGAIKRMEKKKAR